MSTDQNFIYDGLYKIEIDNSQKYIYHPQKNILGIKEEIIDSNYRSNLPYLSSPRILEYKYNIDALIEDLKDGEKNSNEIDMLVVWETGEKWKNHYRINSLLDTNNIYLRPHHGVTHLICNLNTGQEEMCLIVLKELIDFLNDPEQEEKRQIEKYEE